jgi:hypothetical protein
VIAALLVFALAVVFAARTGDTTLAPRRAGRRR